MSGDRVYPDEPAGPFEAPPVSFVDREGRDVKIRPYLDGADDGADADGESGEDGFEALVDMYTEFDPADRAQGIPPGRESDVRSWLETILGDDGYNVIAWNGDVVAGHATLVPDGDAYELAIFVLQAYQGAGIGTHLMEALLGYGAANGIGRVWLTVERWNRAAVGLYKKVGFETSDAESFELEMTALLADPA